MASSDTLHEDASVLGAEVVDRHRALASVQEELEAVDWYDQRVQAATDAELREILAHNRDEEKEHASMVLEWLRRRDGALDQALRTYLFASGSIVHRETEVEGGRPGPGLADAGGMRGGGTPDGSGAASDGSLGIGSLKGKV